MTRIKMDSRNLLLGKKSLNYNSLAWSPGWPDRAIFHQLGYLWRLIMIFWKDEVAQNNGNFWGYFLFKQIYFISKPVSKHGLL
jgi:hypothetical protein